MHASAQLHENLQRILVDLIDLNLQAKQAHWNIVGRNFRDLHLQLDEVADAAREFSDDIAERMRALHVSPDGRAHSVAATSGLPVFPAGEVASADVVDLVAERIESAVGTIRDVHDAVDSEDPSTADILHSVIDRLEQLAWMVSAENRSPIKS
jgi:starvation-inducible DNA-binding protein